MRGLNKFRKLLCFLIVSIIVFGFGGEFVKADVMGSRGTLSGSSYSDLYPTYFQWLYDTNNNQDVYCLNSRSNPPTGMDWPQVPGLVPDDKKAAIVSILRASEGLDLSDKDRYYVTQAAIWYVLEGKASIFGDVGDYSKFENHKKFGTAWSTLMNAIENAGSLSIGEEPRISVAVDTNNGVNPNFTEENGKFITGEYIIGGTGIDGDIDISIDTSYGNAVNACILYNNECTSSVSIPGDTDGVAIRIRSDIPDLQAGETVEARIQLNATSNQTYDLLTYGNLSATNGYQNVATLTTSNSKQLEKKVKVTGVMPEEESALVSIQKLDADTGEKVAGATLAILDSNNNTIGEYESTGTGTANPTLTLSEGDYKLKEIKAPAGYYFNGEEISFSVVKEGSNVVVKQNGSTVSDATISISNKGIKVKFRKLDNLGNPIAGIRFEVYSYMMGYEDLPEGSPRAKMCAISDSQGYFTIPCQGELNTGNVKSSGEYILGKDFGSADDIYFIDEYCDLDICKAYTSARTFGFIIHGGGKSIIPGNNAGQLSYEYSVGDTPIVTLNIHNSYHIDISKSDITKSKEIPGALLTVTDPNATVNEQMGNGKVVDTWTSGDKPHTIAGIIPGHRYRLTEEVEPEGFIKMINSIDFEMDVNGNVTAYDIETGAPITDLAGTDYHLLITNQHKTVFSKTDAVTGEEIAGAHLKVCTTDSYNSAKASTGDGSNCEPFINPNKKENGGRVEWDSVAGEDHIEAALPETNSSNPYYYLVETIAPVGYYKKTTAVPFTVTVGDTSKIEMKNELTKLVITKKNEVTGDRVAGAKFEILNANNREIAKDYKGNDLVWTSDGENDWEILGIPSGDYILVETQTPENFQEGMVIGGELYNEYKFSISENYEDVNIDATTISITNVPKTGISTLNLFAIGGLLVFTGYETIKIYRRKSMN